MVFFWQENCGMNRSEHIEPNVGPAHLVKVRNTIALIGMLGLALHVLSRMPTLTP
jgi:hypothetical protein